MSVLLFVMEHTAEQCALTRKLSVDLQGGSLFVALLLKYRLLNRQIVHEGCLRGDDRALLLRRSALRPFAVKPLLLRLPHRADLLLRPQGIAFVCRSRKGGGYIAS